ncbi:MAG: hypothetical protein ACI4OR_04785 [Alphaproteobacteria bacterium]
MILFLLIVMTSFSVSAQMTDLMGTLAIDGVMNAGAVKGYKGANLQIKKNKLMQELQIKSMEIQTLMMTNPQNVSRETFFISGYPAFAQTEKTGKFSITLKEVEKELCQGLENQFRGVQKIKINQNNICLDKNTIKFYY